MHRACIRIYIYICNTVRVSLGITQETKALAFAFLKSSFKKISQFDWLIKQKGLFSVKLSKYYKNAF